MAIPSSVADIGRAFDIFPGRGGFATNMPTYPGAYGAPYAPQDPYGKSLLGMQDTSQIRSIFDTGLGLWGNRIGESIGSMAGPFSDLSTSIGLFGDRFKNFEDYLREIRDSLKTPTGGTPAPATPVQPPAPAGIARPTPDGTLPDLRNPLDPAADLIVDTGRIITDLPVGDVGPGVDVTTLGGTGLDLVPGTDTLSGAAPPVDVAGFVDRGDGTGFDTAGNWYKLDPSGTWQRDDYAGIDTSFGTGFPDPTVTNYQIGDIVPDAITGFPMVLGTDGLWTPVETGPGGEGAGPPVVDNTVLGGGGDDAVVDATLVPTDTAGLGRSVITLGQGLDAAGNAINIVRGIQNEDPTQSIAGLIGLAGNPVVLNALDIPNIVPGTAGPGIVTNELGETVVGSGGTGGIPLTGAATVASGLLIMGSALASDASDAEKALQAAAGAAQAVGGVAQIMGMEGTGAAMAAVRLALGIAANTLTDKPAEQQAIEAALDTVSAAAIFMGPWGAVVMMAAQVVKIAVTKLFHPDTPHRVREALETSNVGRTVSVAMSRIEQAETAEELHDVASTMNFGENDWIVAIPMTHGADPRETLDLLSGDPTANVQAGVLDQFKDPMNRAVGGMLKRQAGLIRAAEAFSAGSPTPGRQYLASDVDYFMRNIERFDGEPYDALDAAQVERVVGQHLLEVFRRSSGGWYGPWLDPNLVYNQQGIDEPLRRRGVSEEDIEAARQLFAAKAPGLTEIQYSPDPAQAMAELTGLPVRTTRYFVQGAAGPGPTPGVAAEPIVALPDGETGGETEEQRAQRLYEAALATQQGGG